MATTTMRRSTTWLGVMITTVMTQMLTAIMVVDTAMATTMRTRAVDDQLVSGFLLFANCHVFCYFDGGIFDT